MTFNAWTVNATVIIRTANWMITSLCRLPFLSWYTVIFLETARLWYFRCKINISYKMNNFTPQVSQVLWYIINISHKSTNITCETNIRGPTHYEKNYSPTVLFQNLTQCMKYKKIYIFATDLFFVVCMENKHLKIRRNFEHFRKQNLTNSFECFFAFYSLFIFAWVSLTILHFVLDVYLQNILSNFLYLFRSCSSTPKTKLIFYQTNVYTGKWRIKWKKNALLYLHYFSNDFVWKFKFTNFTESDK